MNKCNFCGMELIGKKSIAKWCSNKCCQRYRSREEKSNRPKRFCEHCNGELRGKQKKYCSSICSQKSFRIQNKDSLNQYGRERRNNLRKDPEFRAKQAKYQIEYWHSHPKHKEKGKLRMRNYRKNNPLKNKARDYAKHNISLEGRNCELCGCKENLERHHPDYDRKDFIIPLCGKCHAFYEFYWERGIIIML